MRTVLALTAILLGACSSPTYEDYAAICRSYGFSPGTTAFSQCIQTEHNAYKQGLINAVGAARPIPQPPICTTIGSRVSCF